MSSLNPKDRVSLCLFTFSDGRRCRTPRTGNHPHFCFYHAQKEARAQAAEKLGKDLACFFSGDYLSACDLSTALSRLIPAVVRGEVKPKTARTVAYLIQTLMQSIHISREEYISAFGTEGWRKSIRNGVSANYDHRFPRAPEPEPQQPASSTPPPPTSPSTQLPSNARPLRPKSAPPQPAAPKPNPAAHTPQPPSSDNGPASQTVQPNNPPQPAPLPPQLRPAAPNHDPYAVRFDYNYRLRTDGKLI
jgi:hypothetical protein